MCYYYHSSCSLLAKPALHYKAVYRHRFRSTVWVAVTSSLVHVQANGATLHSPPPALSLLLNQQCSAATPFPTPASAATTHHPASADTANGTNAVIAAIEQHREFSSRCQKFASGVSTAGCVEMVKVTLDVASSGLIAVNFAVHEASQSNAHSHRLFRSLSVGLDSQEVQRAQHESLAILPGQAADDTTSMHDGSQLSYLSHSAAPAWHPQSQSAGSATARMRARNRPPRLASGPFHLDTASAVKFAQTELEEETAESGGETWSMPTPTPLSGRDTVGTGLSQGLASNVSELYERGFQLEQSIQDIDDRGCFRAGQVCTTAIIVATTNSLNSIAPLLFLSITCSAALVSSSVKVLPVLCGSLCDAVRRSHNTPWCRMLKKQGHIQLQRALQSWSASYATPLLILPLWKTVESGCLTTSCWNRLCQCATHASFACLNLKSQRSRKLE